jgi:hypothetical protein
MVGGNLSGLPAVFDRTRAPHVRARREPTEALMHGLIYLIGLIVVIMAILSFFGLR